MATLGIKHVRSVERMRQFAATKGVAAPKAAVIGSGALAAAPGFSLLPGVKSRGGRWYDWGVFVGRHAFHTRLLDAGRPQANERAHPLFEKSGPDWRGSTGCGDP